MGLSNLEIYQIILIIVVSISSYIVIRKILLLEGLSIRKIIKKKYKNKILYKLDITIYQALLMLLLEIILIIFLNKYISIISLLLLVVVLNYTLYSTLKKKRNNKIKLHLISIIDIVVYQQAIGTPITSILAEVSINLPKGQLKNKMKEVVTQLKLTNNIKGSLKLLDVFDEVEDIIKFKSVFYEKSETGKDNSKDESKILKEFKKGFTELQSKRERGFAIACFLLTLGVTLIYAMYPYVQQMQIAKDSIL